MSFWKVYNQHNCCVWQGNALLEDDAWKCMKIACKFPDDWKIEQLKKDFRIVEKLTLPQS